MDIPVLKYVDILIGLSLVMVLVSTIVLAVTQTLLNTTFARARHLQRGLTRMIGQVDPASVREHRKYLAALIVRHPLVGQQTMFTPLRRGLDSWRAARASRRNEDIERLPPISPGSVVQREELAYLLIEFAAGEGPLMDPLDVGATPNKVAEAQAALARALRSTGIEDPAATLRAIRIKAMENERANPDQPATRWRADAVADCAGSDFIGKLHAGFDSTMARVCDGFTGESKLWVSAVALLVAIALQLDSIALVKRLSIDDAYRQTFVDVARTLEEDRAAIEASAESVEKQERLAANRDSLDEARASLALLGSPEIKLLPWITPPPANATGWARVDPFLPEWSNVPGVLLSWLLLSLGAPFWFDALKNLLKLRSLIAQKDDADRQRREAAQPPSPAVPTAAAGATTGVISEAGDLTATGAAG